MGSSLQGFGLVLGVASTFAGLTKGDGIGVKDPSTAVDDIHKTFFHSDLLGLPRSFWLRRLLDANGDSHI